MRRFVTRPSILVLTFCCGFGLTLLYGALFGGAARDLARRAARRLAAPYVAEAEGRHRMRRILVDVRDTWEAPDSARSVDRSYDELEALSKERGEVERRIFPKLFPGGTLEHYGRCSRESRERPAAGEADLARARAGGDFAAHVPEWRKGSFTGPDSFETLYVIDVGECNAREAPTPPSRRLAVFDRWDGLHAAVEALPGETVYAVRDVDGDAADEVLLGRGEMVGTKGVFRMRLVSLKGDRLRVVHDFGVGYVYSSEHPLGDDRVITIPVIYYTPRGDGETPEFEVEFYRAACSRAEGCGFLPRPSEWRYYKSGRLEETDY